MNLGAGRGPVQEKATPGSALEAPFSVVAAEEQRPDDVWLEDILPRLLALGLLLLVPSSDGQRLRCGLGHVDPLPEVAAVLW